MKTIISIILIAASIAFFVFFTKPKWAELKANRLEVEKLNIAQENAKKLKSRIDTLLKARNSITPENYEKISKMVPDNVENVKLIIDFDNMIQEIVSRNRTESIYRAANPESNGKVSIENPKITDSPAIIDAGIDTTKLGIADFSFTVGLTYTDFITLLKTLETSTRIFDIESISFSTPTNIANKNPSEIVYNFNITLKTYWLKSK